MKFNLEIDLGNERQSALDLAEAERLTAMLHTAKGSIDRATGILERDSPLFYGKGDNPTLWN